MIILFKLILLFTFLGILPMLLYLYYLISIGADIYKVASVSIVVVIIVYVNKSIQGGSL